MKIAFLHMTMGLVDRGSEISTGIIASELAKGHEVLVLQSGESKKDTVYKTKRILPLQTAPSPAPKNLVDKLLFRLGLNQQNILVKKFTLATTPSLEQFAPDIVVVTNGSSQLRLLKKHFPSVKAVVFGRAGIGHDDLANLRASPDIFVALTKEARDWAAKKATPVTKVIYLPNPIDQNVFATKKPVSLALKDPVMLIVSALTSYKNVTKLIKAAARANVSLFLIGDGEESGKVEQLLASYPAEHKWLRHVAPHDLPGYYLAADFFAFTPDSQEAFGRVYLEAMAAGLPIIASDDPIRRSIVGSQATYVDPHSPKELQAAIKKLISNHPKLDYSSQLEKYSPSTIVNSLVKELEGII